MKFFKVHHFADFTNLNKLVNADLIKQLGNWLNANKISLNIKKGNL